MNNKDVPKLISAELDGIEAKLVKVEADLNVGIHAFSVVGLADKAVSEAKERVNSALKNSGIKPPSKENRRITVNLAPANLKKAGSRFDLPIAIAYLLASEQLVSFDSSNKLFAGELSLDGALRPINGALNIALLAKEHGIEEIFVPKESAKEASLVKGVSVYPVKNINDIIGHLEGFSKIDPLPHTPTEPVHTPTSVGIGEIKGQESAKRALLVSAAGAHHILMSGPPGTGKTMLAQALASIISPPNPEECIEITRIYSSVGLNEGKIINHRPFRSPHSSSSLVSLLGGGAKPRPGEVSLAHRGVLFLDETPEFNRNVIEGLRQPLEDGVINVARARQSATFPARFILALAKNPCPCGYFDDSARECKCTANEINRYQKKISGPLLDRVDIQIEVDRIPVEKLRDMRGNKTEDEKFRASVDSARKIQEERFKSIDGVITNSDMSSAQVDDLVQLSSGAENFIKKALRKDMVSPRGYYRILKTSRTIADLGGSEKVEEDHLAEAFQYRVRRSRE